MTRAVGLTWMHLSGGLLLTGTFLSMTVRPASGELTSRPDPPEMRVTTASLAPPMSLGVSSVTCKRRASVTVTLRWQASTSTRASGYQVLRSTTNGGPYAAVGSVTGVETTSYTDTSTSFSRTYYYTVRTALAGWRSVPSNQAAVTTPNSRCR
jgi:hypothetical protein